MIFIPTIVEGLPYKANLATASRDREDMEKDVEATIEIERNAERI